MSRQFDRKIKVTVFKQASQKGLEVEDLRVAFEITKDQLGYPNLAQVDIYNLKRDNQNKVKNVFDRVVVEAGYKDNVNQIFLGDMRNVLKVRQGSDMVTRIWAGSNDRGVKQGVLNFTAGLNTDVSNIIAEAAKSFEGVVIGKIDELTGSKKIKGESYSGATRDILDRLKNDYGFDWFVDDGKLNVLKPETALNTESAAVVISSTSGMIDIPALTERGVMVKTLLNSRMKIGRLFRIKSQTNTVQLGNQFYRDINRTIGEGLYKAIKVIHTGDTRSNVWQSVVEGVSFK